MFDKPIFSKLIKCFLNGIFQRILITAQEDRICPPVKSSNSGLRDDALDPSQTKRSGYVYPLSLIVTKPCLALFAFAANGPKQISLNQGDEVSITAELEGWYRGTLLATGQKGIFPANHIKLIKEGWSIFSKFPNLVTGAVNPEDKQPSEPPPPGVTHGDASSPIAASGCGPLVAVSPTPSSSACESAGNVDTPAVAALTLNPVARQVTTAAAVAMGSTAAARAVAAARVAASGGIASAEEEAESEAMARRRGRQHHIIVEINEALKEWRLVSVAYLQVWSRTTGW